MNIGRTPRALPRLPNQVVRPFDPWDWHLYAGIFLTDLERYFRN